MSASRLLAFLAIAVGLAGCGGRSGPPSRISEPPPGRARPPVAWDAPRTLVADGFPFGVAVDRRGRAYVLLDDARGLALRRTDGAGGFAAVRRWAGSSALDARVGVDARGRAIVIVTTPRGLLADVDGRRSWLVRGARVYFGGRSEGALGVAPDGSATAIWHQRAGDGIRDWMAQRRPGRSTFDPPRPFGRDVVQIRVSDDGRVIVWADLPPGAGGYVVNVAVRSAAGRFSAPVVVSRNGSVDATGAIGADGRVVVAWSDHDEYAVHVVERAAGRTTFGSPRTVFRPSPEGPERGIGAIDVAVGARGDATVVWQQEYEQRRDRVAAVDWPARSKPGDPHFVTAAAGAGAFQTDPHVLNGPRGPVVIFAHRSVRQPAGDARTWVAASPGAEPVRLVDAGHDIFPIFTAGTGTITAVWAAESPNGLPVRLSRLG